MTLCLNGNVIGCQSFMRVQGLEGNTQLLMVLIIGSMSLFGSNWLLH